MGLLDILRPKTYSAEKIAKKRAELTSQGFSTLGSNVNILVGVRRERKVPGYLSQQDCDQAVINLSRVYWKRHPDNLASK